MNDQDIRLECMRIIIGLGVSRGVDPRPAAERLYRFIKFGEHADPKPEQMKNAPKPKGNGK